jgi:DNA polymerase elongation subunit (family B)
LNKINSSLPGIIKLEYRGTYKKGLFVSTKTGKGAKKKYALIDKNGELLIRGFETQREDWCMLAKDMQRKLLELILKGDKKKAVKYVRDTIKKLKRRKIKLSDLVITTQLTKPLNKYKSIGPHVVAAKKMISRGIKIQQGMMIKFIIVKGKGSLSERAEPAEGINIKNIDEDYYIKHQLVPSALRVLSIFGVKESDFYGK